MTYAPIHQLQVENYGCIKGATVELSSLHALIGPNDSGKSTVLRAARTAAQFAGGSFEPVIHGERGVTSWTPFDPLLSSNVQTSITVSYDDGCGYRMWGDATEVSEALLWEGQVVRKDQASRAWNVKGLLSIKSWKGTEEGRKFDQAVLETIPEKLRERLPPATMVRFDPNALRRPSRQILVGQPVRFADETGVGLASVYQAISSRDVDAFVKIRDRVRELFPTLEQLQMLSLQGGDVVLQVKLRDGTEVPASALSEGLLYFLGYAALQHLEDSRLFLVEEPENGLHPARIAEVMAILREISKTSQVLIATHSPLVVNELGGHEVSVITRDPDAGTRVTLLKDVPGYVEAMKIYQPGEFWLSYADGKHEEPLLEGKPRS